MVCEEIIKGLKIALQDPLFASYSGQIDCILDNVQDSRDMCPILAYITEVLKEVVNLAQENRIDYRALIIVLKGLCDRLSVRTTNIQNYYDILEQVAKLSKSGISFDELNFNCIQRMFRRYPRLLRDFMDINSTATMLRKFVAYQSNKKGQWVYTIDNLLIDLDIQIDKKKAEKVINVLKGALGSGVGVYINYALMESDIGSAFKNNALSDLFSKLKVALGYIMGSDIFLFILSEFLDRLFDRLFDRLLGDT